MRGESECALSQSYRDTDTGDDHNFIAKEEGKGARTAPSAPRKPRRGSARPWPCAQPHGLPHASRGGARGGRRLRLLLRLDGLDDGLDIRLAEHRERLALAEDADFDRLCAGLDDFEERADGELHRFRFRRAVDLRLLEELEERLRVAADGAGLPRGVDAGGVRRPELRDAVGADAREEGRDAEGADAAALRLLLLRLADVARDLLDGRRVLDRQALRLALHARLKV
jgi:hypothetical protein